MGMFRGCSTTSMVKDACTNLPSPPLAKLELLKSPLFQALDRGTCKFINMVDYHAIAPYSNCIL